MTILIEKEVERGFDFPLEPLIESVVQKSLAYESCPYEVELNVILTNNKEIQEINKNFRGLDTPTDVLSFPAVDFESPADFFYVDEHPERYLNPESGEVILGDIMISVDKVYSQAEEFNHSPRRELAFLVAHSMLHLLGYDHVLDSDRELMEKKQEEILTQLGIERN